jgi:hypothetical protein
MSRALTNELLWAIDIIGNSGERLGQVDMTLGFGRLTSKFTGVSVMVQT